MKLRACLSLAMITVVLTGCAGGWRNGAPAGTNAMAAPAGAAAAAPAKVKGTAKDGAKTAAAATTTAVASDGARFVYKGEAKSVNVAGEFNAWNTSADALTKQADGSWVLVKKLDPGKYAYKFVIDGGTWKADDLATETIDDGYGGKNSVVVVGGGAGAATSAAAPAAAAATPVAANTVNGKGAAPVVTADGVRFTYAGAATQVNLAGDFNSWSTSSDALKVLADGTWTITRKITAGTYGYKFLINGKTWKQDESNPEAKDDGFGGKNSIVTIK